VTPASRWARLVPLAVAIGLAVVGCSSNAGHAPSAAPAPETAPAGSSATLPDPMVQTASPPGAQLTLASTTLVVGETTEFAGTACPPGDRGNLGILPDRTVTRSNGQPDYIASGVAGEDGRWSFAAPVPDSVVGSAWTIANCEDTNTGTIVFTYPRVPVTVKPAP